MGREAASAQCNSSGNAVIANNIVGWHMAHGAQKRATPMVSLSSMVERGGDHSDGGRRQLTMAARGEEATAIHSLSHFCGIF